MGDAPAWVHQPHGRGASFEILEHLVHEVIRAIVFGDDFDGDVGSHWQGNLLEINAGNALRAKEGYIGPADRTVEQLHIGSVKTVPR